MDESCDNFEERFRVTEVGDTLRMRIDKSMLRADVRDRVSPVLTQPAKQGDRLAFQGFTKDANGMWDLESVTGAKDSNIVEVIVRRAASDI
jgi:hypothetical protein